MATYDLVPYAFDNTVLEPESWVDFVRFSPQNGPMQSDPNDAVEAAVIGVGDRHVRSQPRGATWELFLFLASTNETDRIAMLRLFSRERGLVYLDVQDGDATLWRVACSVTGVDRQSASQYIVRLRVPDTRMEASALATLTDSNNSGDSAALTTITNSGDRKARPTFTIDADAVKTVDPAADYMQVERSFFVNRAPFPLVDYPIDLTGYQDATTSPYDTAALIRSAAQNLANGAIGANDVTINIDTPTSGGLPTGVGGFAMIDAGGSALEQIYYANNSGTQLTGVVRRIGGTTGTTHTDNTVIRASYLLKDGSDLRVFVDGQEVERWFGGLDTASTRFWINASAPKRLNLTLDGAITASVPAAAGEVQFNEDLSQVPESGLFVIDLEMFSYTGRDLANRRLTGIERAVWFTTAATHADAADAYFHPRLVVIALGRYNLGPAPEPVERRPAIQLLSSTNKIFRWGDETDDANTVFYDSARPNRSMQFRPVFETPAADLNAGELPRLDTSSTKAAWKDSVPAAGKLQVGRLSVFLPTGTKVAATGVELDYQPRQWARMRLLGRDINGFETELLDQYDYAEVAVPAQDGNPTGIMHELTLNAVRAATTGHGKYTGAAAYEMLTNGASFQTKLVLDQSTLLDSILLRLRKAAAGDNFTFTVSLRDSSGATPNLGVGVWAAREWSGDASLDNFSDNGLSTSQAWYRFYNTQAGDVLLSAGTYWIEVKITWTSGTLYWQRGDALEGRNDRAYNAVGALWGAPAVFYLIHKHGGPVQPEAPILNTNVEASFDKVIVTLNDASGDPYYPLVHRFGGFESLYHANGRLTNDANDYYFDLDAWLDLGKVLTVDCENHTAYYVDGEWTLRCPAAVRPSSAAEWFALEPGANNLTWTEANMANTDLVVTYRARRA